MYWFMIKLCFRVSNHIVKVTSGFVMLSKIATPYPSDVLSGQSQSFSKPHLHWWMKTDIMVEWSFRLLPVLWVLASQLRTTTSSIMYITENPKHPQVFLYFLTCEIIIIFLYALDQPLTWKSSHTHYLSNDKIKSFHLSQINLLFKST